jgi:hypothetical protein
MAVAALVLSIVATFIAGLSAWYTRRQAASAEDVRRIETGRRHDELLPNLVGVYVGASETRDGQRPGVRITNQGPLDLDRVNVEVVPAHRADEAVIEGIHDYRSGEGTAAVHETGRLRHGESWTFEVLPARYEVEAGHELDRGGTAVFRCTCFTAGHEPWVVIVSVAFPTSPWIY